MSDLSWLGPRIDVRPLLAEQQAGFRALLAELGPADWARPTGCPGWTVHDVAAHVLGDHVGRLSIHRDGHQPLHPGPDEPFPAWLHRINDEWVTGARRISPPLLIDLLSTLSEQIVEHWHQIDLEAPGWAVTWAGPGPAPNWLDLARDYTEYWTHHQQIAEAVGRTGLTGPEHLGAVIDTFLRALPHTLRGLCPAAGTTLQVTVTGPAGGTWTSTRQPGRWAIRRGAQHDPDGLVVLDQDIVWRLATRGITPARAAELASTAGSRQLTDAALTLVSIIY